MFSFCNFQIRKILFYLPIGIAYIDFEIVSSKFKIEQIKLLSCIL